MALKDYKVFLWIAIALFGVFAGIYVWRQYQAPLETLREQNQQLRENITELQEQVAGNQTKADVDTESGVNGLTILFLLTTLIFGGYLVYLKLGKQSGIAKNRHEVIEHLRKYAKEKDGVTLHKLLKYTEGFYKADHDFPVALVAFTRIEDWKSDIEPPKYYNYGYLVDRRDLDNVIEDFFGVGVQDMIESIKDTTYGLRTPHYKPYKTKSYEEAALKQFYEKEEAIKEAVEFRKAVEDRA